MRFVKVACPGRLLLKSTGNLSEAVHDKLMSPRILEEPLDRNDLESGIPFFESVEIDSPILTPVECARRIVDFVAAVDYIVSLSFS